MSKMRTALRQRAPPMTHAHPPTSPPSLPDRKATEERSSSKKDNKPSEGDAPPTKASSEAEPMETEAAAAAAAPSDSSPLLNGQQELLHSEGDTQSN